MKILIAIPSKKRAEVLKKNAFGWVPLTGIDYKIFIEKEDYEDYIKLFPAESLIVLPDSGRGLGFSKNNIKKYATENGYEIVIKIDDDISGWTDFRKRVYKEEAAKRFNYSLGQILEAMKPEEVACVSFPYAFQMFESYSFKKSKRVQTAYICKLEYFHADDRISAFEDFSVGLNAIVKGKLILSYGLSGIVMGVQVGKGEGGHQTCDREKQALSEVDILREIYPALKFRKVDKVWKYEPDLRSVKKVGFY